MNESLEREIAEMTALTSPRKSDEVGSRIDNGANAAQHALRQSWLHLGDLLESASVEVAQTNEPVGIFPPPPVLERPTVQREANRLRTERHWGVWAVAGGVLLTLLAVGAQLPSARQNPVILSPLTPLAEKTPVAENTPPPNQNATANGAIKIANAPQVKPNVMSTPEATADDAASLAWDSDLDDSIASAEIAVWSFESNARPTAQSFRWIDTQIQQLEQDFQGNSL